MERSNDAVVLHGLFRKVSLKVGALSDVIISGWHIGDIQELFWEGLVSYMPLIFTSLIINYVYGEANSLDSPLFCV